MAWIDDRPLLEFVDRAMHTLVRTMEWTYRQHEQTCDISANARIPWAEKKRWTDREIRYHFTQ